MLILRDKVFCDDVGDNVEKQELLSILCIIDIYISKALLSRHFVNNEYFNLLPTVCIKCKE